MCYGGDVILSILWGIWRQNSMNDQILYNAGDRDLAESFGCSLELLRGCVEQDDVVGSLAGAKSLQGLFDRLLQAADPDASYQIRASLTEIHRLLRILNRDLLFWQGAKQTRAGRSTQVLATLGSIEGFSQALMINHPQEQG
jgi:hypothetical protein